MLSTISTKEEQITVNMYTCSDGKRFLNPAKANKHEMYMHLEDMFGDIAIRKPRRYEKKWYYFSRQFALENGVYHIILKDDDDLETALFFLKGFEYYVDIDKEYPIEFDLEIYCDEDVRNAINQKGRWRIYKTAGFKY